VNKFVKLTEIFKKENIATFSNTAGSDTAPKYYLREVMINPDHVTMFWTCVYLKNQLIEEDNWPDGLDQRQEFTKLQINDRGTFYVIGQAQLIAEKLLEGR